MPLPGNSFIIIDNDGTDPIIGTFTGLAEGSTVMFNGVSLQLTYVGGTGNDVVLSLPDCACSCTLRWPCGYGSSAG